MRAGHGSVLPTSSKQAVRHTKASGGPSIASKCSPHVQRAVRLGRRFATRAPTGRRQLKTCVSTSWPTQPVACSSTATRRVSLRRRCASHVGEVQRVESVRFAHELPASSSTSRKRAGSRSLGSRDGFVLADAQSVRGLMYWLIHACVPVEAALTCGLASRSVAPDRFCLG